MDKYCDLMLFPSKSTFSIFISVDLLLFRWSKQSKNGAFAEGKYYKAKYTPQSIVIQTIKWVSFTVFNCFVANHFLPEFCVILCKHHQIYLIFQESEHARRSERMVDDQINIAIESRETLMSQRVAFKAIQVLFCVLWDIFVKI